MLFAEQLNRYMDELPCTPRELAEASGVSPSSLSRYRSGKRIPETGGNVIKQLAAGLAMIAEKRADYPDGYEEEGIEHALLDAAEASHERFDYEGFRRRINLLTAELHIHMADLARASHYDLSGFSRICSGKRHPNHPQLLAEDIAGYVASNFRVNGGHRRVMRILGASEDMLWENGEYRDRIAMWLMNSQEEQLPFQGLLHKVDSFVLEDYLRQVSNDAVHESAAAFRAPLLCEYRGPDGMLEGEMDFFRSTSYTKSYQDLILYSDFPLEGCSTDSEIVQRWMYLVAGVLKKGIRINLIHDLNKPLDQIEHVISKWMPLYMIGHISPWYLPDPPSGYFHHLLMVSGNTAYTGEAVVGHHAEGKYVLTTQKEVVKYTEERAALLLEKAKPLMDAFQNDRRAEYQDFLKKDEKKSGIRRSALASPPIYTIRQDLLKTILQHNRVPEEQAEHILDYADRERKRFLSILKHDRIIDLIAFLGRQEMERFPVFLSLAGLFPQKNILYRYEEYREHLHDTEEEAKKLKGYTVIRDQKSTFRNIHITSREGKWVMISNNRSPAIHYIVYHERLQKAFENLFLG